MPFWSATTATFSHKFKGRHGLAHGVVVDVVIENDPKKNKRQICSSSVILERPRTARFSFLPTKGCQIIAIFWPKLRLLEAKNVRWIYVNCALFLCKFYTTRRQFCAFYHTEMCVCMEAYVDNGGNDVGNMRASPNVECNWLKMKLKRGGVERSNVGTRR